MKGMLESTQTFLDQVQNHLTTRRMRWFCIFIVFRFLLWVMMVVSQATVLSNGKWTQYLYFLSTARLTDYGYYPLIGHWIEYPPIFPWLNALLYRLSVWLMPDSSSWVLFFALLGLVFTLAEIGIFILIYRIIKYMVNQKLATVAAFIFAITSWPTYLFYGWYDPIAAFFLIWGLERLIVGRFTTSAVAVGLGFLTKLFPLMLVAVVVRVETSIRKRALYILVVIGVIALVVLPFAYINPEMMGATLRWLPNKSTYQTVYALVDGYLSYGEAPGAWQFTDPNQAGWVHHPSRVPTLLVTIVFAVIGLYVYTRPRPTNNNVAIVVLSGLIMQLMLLYLKGYSPQFILWFLPLIVLILPDARGLWYALSFVILNVLEYPLYFTFWEDMPPILVVIILARTILWILLAFEYWGVYRGRIATPLLDEANAG
jgi:hypothetical protein